jgi:hypothetical protein
MERENRYLVLKRKDLELLSDEAKEELEDIVFAVGLAKSGGFEDPKEGAIDCAVVERDWPMYEQVWQMVEDWVHEQVATGALPDTDANNDEELTT